MELFQGIFVALAAFLMGGFLLAYPRGRSFSLLSFAAGCYVLALAALMATRSMSLSPVVIASGAALLAAALHFALGFERARQRRDALAYVPLVLIALLGFTGLFVSGAHVDAAGRLLPEHGPGATALAALVIAYVISIYVLMHGAVRRSAGRERIRAWLLLAAFSLLLSSVTVFNVIAPVLGYPALNALTGIALLAFLGIATYALSVRELFDVRLPLYRTFRLGILPASVIAGGIVTAALAERYAPELSGTYHALALIGGVLAAVLIAQAFLPRSEARIRRFFFPDLLSDERIAELVAGAAHPSGGMRELHAGIRYLLMHLYRPARLTSDPDRIDDASSVSVLPERLELTINGCGAFILEGRLSGEPFIPADGSLATRVLPHLRAAASRAREHDALRGTTRRLSREVDALQEAERRLVADIAHGLQTPLAVLRADLEGMRGVPDTARGRIARSIDDLSSRMRSLVDYARAGVPLTSGTRSTVRLDALVRDIADYVGTVAEERGVALRLGRLDAATVSGRKSDLEAMITNVVSNALRHAVSGAAPHEVLITLEAGAAGSCLTVTDTGSGMSDEERTRAFETLYRGSGGGSGSGMGLGLAIARQVAEAHGGSISLETGPGGGTSVRMRLPGTEGELLHLSP